MNGLLLNNWTLMYVQDKPMQLKTYILEKAIIGGLLLNNLTLLYIQDKPEQLQTCQLTFGKSYNAWTAKYLNTFVYIE